METNNCSRKLSLLSCLFKKVVTALGLISSHNMCMCTRIPQTAGNRAHDSPGIFMYVKVNLKTLCDNVQNWRAVKSHFWGIQWKAFLILMIDLKF